MFSSFFHTHPRSFLSWRQSAVLLLLSSQSTTAITLDLDSQDSIKQAASTIAYGMMSIYTGNRTGDTPGNLPQPYFWWECGAMFGAMLDYYYYTGDPSYNEVTTQALLAQVGPNEDYMTPNQTKTEGNDDQGFWGLAAMSAAEQNFPNPPAGQPQWLGLAQGVFNTQAARWDMLKCNGGLRWQIFPFNNGYNYKNAISNGVFFNLGARLAMYTGNATYANWAAKTWDWVNAVGLMSPKYEIFDGTDDNINCTQVNHIQWSYNAGVYLLGAANMYAFTNGSDLWRERIESLLNATDVFFSPDQPNVMYEVACEMLGTCNTDQMSFKAYLSRWLAATTKVAPFTTDAIMTKLRASAAAAALQCSGGSDGKTCGLQWTKGAVWDGTQGVGQQMAAMEVIQSNLIKEVKAPVTNATGGTSQGNTGGGGKDSQTPEGIIATRPFRTRDRVGAGLMTIALLGLMFGTAVWICV